mgnify:CR=1 FL=1
MKIKFLTIIAAFALFSCENADTDTDQATVEMENSLKEEGEELNVEVNQDVAETTNDYTDSLNHQAADAVDTDGEMEKRGEAIDEANGRTKKSLGDAKDADGPMEKLGEKIDEAKK